jgi:chorismate synthase
LNTLGNIFKVHSFGESHGLAVGAVIDGCPAGLNLDLESIQRAVDKRKTGQHSFSSARKEEDAVEILSGIFEGKTMGTPICILIKNKDARSKDYDKIKDVFRPGHADFAYQEKYGDRDYRGGGRSSIRITAPLVAAGEIANQLLAKLSKAQTISYVTQIGKVRHDTTQVLTDGLTNEERSFLEASDKNIINKDFESQMLEEIGIADSNGDTLGGKITTLIEGLPAGIGEPIFGKLQAQLSQALMSINTVKALEFGEGVKAAEMKGSEHNDEFEMKGNSIATKTNHHGGILGGISTGNRIVFSVYFKPISSIKKEQQTVNKKGETVNIEIGGRHDVCAVPRAVPIVEAYTNIVLADLILKNRNATI